MSGAERLPHRPDVEPPVYSHRSGLDPREKFHMLVGILPEGNFQAWERWGVCLCGCGERPSAAHTQRPHEINYWMNGHYPALLKQHGLKKGPPRTQRQKNAARAYNLTQTIDGRLILEMVREVVENEYGGNLSKFCRERLGDGTTHSSLAYNLNRGVTRLTKRRAKALLIAIGEKPHASLG